MPGGRVVLVLFQSACPRYFLRARPLYGTEGTCCIALALRKGNGDCPGGHHLELVSPGMLWNGEARVRVQRRLPGGGGA